MLFAGKLSFLTRIRFVFVALLLCLAIYYFGVDKEVSSTLHSLGIVGSLVAGAFYTFGLTTPSAILILLEMMYSNDYLSVALVASLAAAAVDVTLFLLLRETLEQNAFKLMKKIRKKFGKSRIFYFIGFLLFGSPFPDELALAFLQIKKINPLRVYLLIFFAKLLTLILLYHGFSLFA